MTPFFYSIVGIIFAGLFYNNKKANKDIREASQTALNEITFYVMLGMLWLPVLLFVGAWTLIKELRDDEQS